MDYPSRAEWKARHDWFQKAMEPDDDVRFHPGEHAATLVVDLEQVFCAGAWLASVMLATAVVEAHLRETLPVGSPMENTRDLFDRAGLPAEYEELRLLRNRLMHVTPGEPAMTTDMHWSHAEEFEADARDAVVLAAAALRRRISKTVKGAGGRNR